MNPWNISTAFLLALAGRMDCFGARIELAKEEEKSQP
jgi:hypothetical protein